MSSSNEPVVGDHWTRNTREKNTISAEISAEGGGRRVEQPGVHADTDDGGNVSTPANREVSREEGSQITAGRNRVGSNIEQKPVIAH